MGVRGLTRHCYQNEERASTPLAELQDATLAVDFVGFLYFVCDHLFQQVDRESGVSARAWLLLGGERQPYI